MAAYIERGDVQFVYKHRIVTGPDAQIAAEAAECAGEQGKFMAYHDQLFNSQPKKFGRADHIALAGSLGLESKSFTACLDSGRNRDKVRQQDKEGQQAGVDATPTFFVNGQKIRGVPETKEFLATIDALIKK